MYKRISKYIKRYLFIFLLIVSAGGLALVVARRNSVEKPTVPTVVGSQTTKEWSKKVEELVATKGIDGALGALGDLDGKGGASGQLCHDLTHLIGQKAYLLYMRGKPFQVTRKAQYCSFGFFHGVIEALVAATGDVKGARKFCEFLATQKDFAASDATYHCYHGIGHGAVNPHDPALWGDVIKIVTPALALCRDVAQNREELVDCGTGVFAGLAAFYTGGEYGLTLSAILGDPFWICRQIPDEFAESCYRDMHSVARTLANGDFRRAATFYEKIREDEYAISGLRSLGVALEEFRQGDYPYETGLGVCRSLQERLLAPCIQTIAREMIQRGKIGDELKEAKAFCEQPQLTPKEKDACFGWLILYVRWYDEGKAREFCDSMPTLHQDTCREQIVTR
jgi:hypothetical protein